jgi:hypothetical protein
VTINSRNKVYFDIIREKLKESVPEDNGSPVDPASVKGMTHHIQKNLCHKIHTKGPHKSPTLFDRHFMIRFAYNYVPSLFSKFKSDYYIVDKCEASFQRLRTDYPLRTVGLGIGNLSGIDFDFAMKHARYMSARGYMETITMITNHDLHSEDFNVTRFYEEIVENFMQIYTTHLHAAGKKPENNKFLNKLAHETTLMSKFHYIKEEAEMNLNANKTFALCRAVELRKGEITWDSILEEIESKCKKAQKKPSEKISIAIPATFYGKSAEYSLKEKDYGTFEHLATGLT